MNDKLRNKIYKSSCVAFIILILLSCSGCETETETEGSLHVFETVHEEWGASEESPYAYRRDITLLVTLMCSAEAVAYDAVYDVPAGTRFIINITEGWISLRLQGTGNGNTTEAVIEGWADTALFTSSITLSASYNDNNGTIQGIVQQNGSVSWYWEGTVCSTLIGMSEAFAAKFG